MPTESEVFNIAWPYIVTYIAGHGGSLILAKVRNRLHNIRQLVDIFDDAMTNNTVTEAEAQATWKIVKSRFANA